MGPKEEKTYFLYGIGRTPDLLCLGNLVLKDYANPTNPLLHYTHGRLSDLEQADICSISELSNCVLRSSSERTFGLKLDLAELLQLDLSWAVSKERILAAKSGRRVELKDPIRFLNDSVLPPENHLSRPILQLWLTAPALKRVLDRFGLRKPKIWMLTGLYELEGARFYEMEKTGTGASASIDSVAIGALTGVPVGGGIDLGSGYTMREQGVGLDGRHVWAAQYRRLDVSYVKAQPGSAAGQLPTAFSLLPDVLSHGLLRADISEVSAAVVQALEGGEPAPYPGEGEVDDEDEYYEELTKVISELHGYYGAVLDEDVEADEPESDEE